MSFEISISSFRGKRSGIITEKGRRSSTRIRFGENGLSQLLDGVELCIQKEGLKEFCKS